MVQIKKFSDIVRGNVTELIENVMSNTEARSMQCRRNINGNFECCDVPVHYNLQQARTNIKTSSVW